MITTRGMRQNSILRNLKRLPKNSYSPLGMCEGRVIDLSFNLNDRTFKNVRSILQGACHMVAMQIAYEPLVRQALRQVFSTRAVVNVTPTKKGKKVK